MGDEERDTLLSFVDAYVTSFEAWDILMYFAAHPDRRADTAGLARDIGRRSEELAAAAATLVQSGVLVRVEAGGWELSNAEDVRRGLALFASAVHNQQDRLFILTRLLERLSR